MKALLDALHRLSGRKSNAVDEQHANAIRLALPHRPQVNEYRSWAISHINFLRKDLSGDHVYQVQVNAWDPGEEPVTLIWEVQTGIVDGEIAAVYWVPL